jgi:membrane associated rhomboid family serine protease
MGDFVVHGLLLRSDYMQLTGLFRPEDQQQQYFALMVLAHVILAGAFVWIYARGVEARPWIAQGVRYGIAVALLTVVPSYMIYFVVQPMPGAVVVKQIVFDGILIVILGMIVAWLYRDKAAPA